MIALRLTSARPVRRREAILVSLAGLTLLTLGCQPRLEIYPSRLQVEAQLPADVEILVAAHLRDRKGKVLSNPITWSMSASAPFVLIPMPESPGLITLRVKANTPAGTVAELIAQAGGKRSVTVVTFANNANPPSTDMALADRVNGGFPSVAMTSGKLGGCVTDSIFPFVGAAELGQWTTGPCVFTERAVVFTENHAPRFYAPHSWTGPSPEPPDVFDLTSGPTVQALVRPTTSPPGFTPLRLKVFALGGVTAADASRRFDDAIKVAFARYTEALAGIYFTSDGSVTEVPDNVKNCVELYDLLNVNPLLADEASLNVFYVRRIDWSVRGFWCSKPTSSGPYPRNLILIATDHDVTSTLAHEIGHSLAQSEPWVWRGHANLVKGMSSDNLMWGDLEDAQAAARWRLGVGQVFRMYQDQRSWFNAEYIPSGVDCGCNPYRGLTCPKLSAEVLEVADRSARITGATCP